MIYIYIYIYIYISRKKIRPHEDYKFISILDMNQNSKRILTRLHQIQQKNKIQPDRRERERECVFVCVCVRERERKREREMKEREERSPFYFWTCLLLLYIDLWPGQTCNSKVMHRNKVTHSDASYQKKSRGGGADKMGQGKILWYTHRLMHRKRVTCELHDSYFCLMTIKPAILKIEWAIELLYNSVRQEVRVGDQMS